MERRSACLENFTNHPPAPLLILQATCISSDRPCSRSDHQCPELENTLSGSQVTSALPPMCTCVLTPYGELYSHRTPAHTVLCLAPVTSITFLMSTDDRTPSPSTVWNLQISLMRMCLSLTSWTICLFSLATLLVKHTLFLLLRRVLCLLLLCNCISFLSFHISRYWHFPFLNSWTFPLFSINICQSTGGEVNVVSTLCLSTSTLFCVFF